MLIDFTMAFIRSLVRSFAMFVPYYSIFFLYFFFFCILELRHAHTDTCDDNTMPMLMMSTRNCSSKYKFALGVDSIISNQLHFIDSMPHSPSTIYRKRSCKSFVNVFKDFDVRTNFILNWWPAIGQILLNIFICLWANWMGEHLNVKSAQNELHFTQVKHRFVILMLALLSVLWSYQTQQISSTNISL